MTDCPEDDAWNCKYCERVSKCDLHSTPDNVVPYHCGNWFKAKTIEEMHQFYVSSLPFIREAARKLGYAIGLHGSTRRDLDLIAMAWVENAADKNTLARAIAIAACGIARDGDYEWRVKPLGRVATSIPICNTAWHDMLGAGHIDLSVIGEPK